MVASCPSLRCSCRKRLCYAEKQRVWICYNTVIVLSVVPCDCCKPTSTCWDWAFSNSELDVCLPAFQLLLEAGAASLSAAHVCKMWHTAKRDLRDMFVSEIHSRQSFLEFQASTPYSYQKLELPQSGNLHQPCIMVASCPSLRCSCRKKSVICREAEGLVELWSPRFVTIQWLCCQLCYVTAANQRTIVEIEFLATVSWTCVCQPCSCRCSQNVMHCRKEMCWTCLFKESMPFVKSKPPLPPRSLSFLRASYVPPSLH